MATPSELIRRAEECRRMRRAVRQREEVVQAEAVFAAEPMPTSHASYSRLMRSHDRVRTRHLSKGGA